MNKSLSTLYRVVCSVNPDKSDRYYIDFCKDGFCSHDILFRMQQKYYNEANLERVFNDSRGIFLREGSNGDIVLVYTKHRDPMAQMSQAKKRAKVDAQIIKAFKEMREKGLFQSISVPLSTVNTELAETCQKKGYTENPQEEAALVALNQSQRLEKLKKIRADFYARQKYASKPHLKLMLAQLERSGD